MLWQPVAVVGSCLGVESCAGSILGIDYWPVGDAMVIKLVVAVVC